MEMLAVLDDLEAVRDKLASLPLTPCSTAPAKSSSTTAAPDAPPAPANA